MIVPFKYDLHIHSTCSDGTLTPFEILSLAKDVGLAGLSITDHDTIDAYSDDLFFQANTLNLKLITGAEFSSSEKGVTVHILAYHFDHKNEDLRNFCLEHQKYRDIRNQEIIHKLSKKGFKITFADLEEKRVSKNQVLGRPHIGQLLLERGHVRKLSEAFDRYLGDGKSCYVEPKNPSIEKTIEIIKHAGGKAILAHPQLFKHRKILKEILKKPFDGMECYYARMPRSQAEGYAKMAKEKNWLITGGSDFHGINKSFLRLGSSFIQEEDFNLLIR